MILAKEQRTGAAILLGIAFTIWLTAAFHRGSSPSPSNPPATPGHRSWEQRKDSIRQADSLRYAQWSEEREQRYDSFRMADAARREAWKQERQHRYDSLRQADSLWRDSIGLLYAGHIKKDTILDLNHCDTTELQYIRGIGRYTAVQIIHYRTQLGGYCSPVQLTDEALSNCRLDTLLPHFTADPSDVETIPVNICSIDRLQRHPYLRYHQAKAIYTLRRKRLRLSSADDLRVLPELTEEEIKRISPYLSFE